MGKRRRKKTANKLPPKIGRGFDFGHLPRAMFASTSSFEFNNQMIAASVSGCAYGYDTVEGYPFPMPCLTLLGENKGPLLEASKILEYWGCREDGDSVDMTIVLKNDGGYLLGMQPSYRRMVNKSRKDAALVDTLFAGATWIKTMDSTNDALREWMDYRKSKLSPVKVLLATVESKKKIPRPETIRLVPDAISFVKFDLEILTEAENPKHWFFDIVRHRKVKGSKGPPQSTPAAVASARCRVIDSVFPVSRQRIRRANLLTKVQGMTNAENLTPSQIEQAAINVVLSQEWADGRDHYQGLEGLDEKWWELARKRVEVCGTTDPFETIDPATVLHQLELDVEHTLRKHGATVTNKFATNQRQFVRLGYAAA